jgi:putative Holliday junction resolvase
MGLDIGDRRIGVALSDPGEILASPLIIIDRSIEPHYNEAIIKIVKEREVGRIIVGLPCAMDGGIGQQAEKVQTFVETLKSRTNIPIEFRDERLTTVTAVRLKRESSGKKVNIKTRYDAMAAAIILQEYLDEKSSAGGVQIQDEYINQSNPDK